MKKQNRKGMADHATSNNTYCVIEFFLLPSYARPGRCYGWEKLQVFVLPTCETTMSRLTH